MSSKERPTLSFWVNAAPAVESASEIAEGTNSATVARNSSPACTRALTRLYSCTWCLSPPSRNEAPSMNSVLVTMAPAIDAFTSMYCPARSAARAITSSVRFPSVALSNPPTASPTFAPTDSVARLSNAASGTIAITESTKLNVCASGRTVWQMNGAGTSTSSHSSGLWRISSSTLSSERNRDQHERETDQRQAGADVERLGADDLPPPHAEKEQQSQRDHVRHPNRMVRVPHHEVGDDDRKRGEHDDQRDGHSTEDVFAANDRLLGLCTADDRQYP